MDITSYEICRFYVAKAQPPLEFLMPTACQQYISMSNGGREWLGRIGKGNGITGNVEKEQKWLVGNYKWDEWNVFIVIPNGSK